MILQPGIIALLVSSLLISLMTLYAAGYGYLILRRWDISSGSELQLILERRTYLISTIVSYFLAFQLISLFLFIQIADSISHLFVGAMCAVGTLAVNSFGYPTLLLKVVTFILAGLWLILNHADNLAYDYPLIRAKYLLLLIMTPFVLAETVLQSLFFLGMKPDIITSCCGSLFSLGSASISGTIAALPHRPMQIMFFAGMAATMASGLHFYRKDRGCYLFSLASAGMFLIAAASVVSFICLYVYELPTHHCPFCLLQKEYGFIGYPLYITLFGGAVAGSGVGVLMPLRNHDSLAGIIPGIQRRLTLVTLTCYLLFSLITVWKMLSSMLMLG